MSETPHEAARRLSASMISRGFVPTGLHTYTNSSGDAIYWRIRLKHPDTGEKWIRPMKLNGGGYELGEPKFLDGKPLYALPHIVNSPDVAVWVVEGEQKADALNNLGLVASTSGGATSAKTVDWQPLSKHMVIIWPDNDDAGSAYASEVANILLGLGCTVFSLDVGKLGLGKGEDVMDWLAANPGATLNDIEILPRLIEPDRENILPCDPDSWPAPLPLVAKLAHDPYPLDALPDTIRAAVIEVQGFTRAPVPLVASSALAALSLAIQPYYDVKRAEMLTGPTSLFLLTIADSGERKSTCDGFFTKAVRDYEEAQAEAAKPVLKDYYAAIGAWEARNNGVRDKIRQLAKANNPTASLEEALRILEHSKPEPPRVPRLLYTDATPEALAYGLAKQWPAGGVVSAEAGIVFGAHGMGKDSIMRNLGLLNTLWDGGAITIDRRTMESFTVRGARLTVALQVQEPTLREFLNRSGDLARGTGFLARFLVAWPESTQGFRPFTEAPDNWPNLAGFNQRISEILSIPAPIDQDGALIPALLALSSEAKKAWIRFHDAIEAQLPSGGNLYDVRDVASKIADNAVRLAALFAVFENGTGPIGLQSFEAASRITLWHLSEARRFFGELALPLELADAARLDAWLIEYCRNTGTNTVGKNDVRQRGPGPLRKGARLDAAISELADFDRVRLMKDGKRQTIAVNPELMSEGGGS